MRNQRSELAAHTWVQRARWKGRAWSLIRARGNNFTQLRGSSWNILTILFFRVVISFHLSWGLGVERDKKMPRDLRALDKVWEIWEMNSGQRSDWREAWIQNGGIISQRKRWESVWTLLLEARNASTPPENVSARTRWYLAPLIVGIWVKSICQSVPWKNTLD